MRYEQEGAKEHGMMMIAKLQEESDGEAGRKGAPTAWRVSCKKIHSSQASPGRNNRRKNTDTVETR